LSAAGTGHFNVSNLNKICSLTADIYNTTSAQRFRNLCLARRISSAPEETPTSFSVLLIDNRHGLN